MSSGPAFAWHFAVPCAHKMLAILVRPFLTGFLNPKILFFSLIYIFFLHFLQVNPTFLGFPTVGKQRFGHCW